MKILLVGHACSPDAGSEPSTTWNWAWHLAAQHQVWAIVHNQYRPSVDRFLAEHPNPNLKIVWCELPQWRDPWKPEVSERGLKLHYVLWQRAALKTAIRLHNIHHFDIAHQVTMGTVSAPSPMWKLPVKFVWGSIGGGQTAPPAFRKYFGAGWRSEVVRTTRVKALRYVPSLRRAVRNSALVLATNWETKQLIEDAGGKTARFYLDCGTLPGWLPGEFPRRAGRADLTLLWSSRHEYRKALPLALEAMARVKHLPVRMLVTGRGPQGEEWKQLAHSLGLDGRVEFLGMVPRNDLPGIFYRADAFLYTSLRDSSGSVVLEAMAQGLPIIALNHHGVGAFVPSDAGSKVAVTNPEETVAGLARSMEQMALCPELRNRQGEAGWKFAHEQTWARRAVQVTKWYQECLEA